LAAEAEVVNRRRKEAIDGGEVGAFNEDKIEPGEARSFAVRYTLHMFFYYLENILFSIT
jgi:hypothetical protein